MVIVNTFSIRAPWGTAPVLKIVGSQPKFFGLCWGAPSAVNHVAVSNTYLDMLHFVSKPEGQAPRELTDLPELLGTGHSTDYTVTPWVHPETSYVLDMSLDMFPDMFSCIAFADTGHVGV